jgi:hypothetical protein
VRSRDGVYDGDDGVIVRRAARRTFTEPLVFVGGSGSVLDPGPAELEAAAVGTRDFRRRHCEVTPVKRNSFGRF